MLIQTFMLQSNSGYLGSRKAILASKNSSVYQINAISFQDLLHVAATHYPMLTVQVIQEILSDFP